ncbi:hypothetical protein GYMLUDRAFT_59567 [Collybiopsis luxurians FD-317 M1]|uniref:Methyltransferase small domain-containing protein n=1 Tax=Collybiopsis luxurians FD-317 M1 TaxID=944289 RepID=A0A0D0CD85_9AGAR|nr:hypothetical protein GYMLUDRAFT_59567 [Collybiopsis luxurians FD-317 M1]
MIPTPDLSHLSVRDYEHIYEPAGAFFTSHAARLQSNSPNRPEDTFLLLDALEADSADLKAIRARIFLEVGYLKFKLISRRSQHDDRFRSGSGCVSAFVGTILGSSTLYLATDINYRACDCTRRTGSQNHVTLDSVQTSFTNGLYSRLEGSVDVLCFNPPYVPTGEAEASKAQGQRGIEGSWAGGLDGMQVTSVFLGMVHKLLSPAGRFYLVAVKENNIPDIQKRMKELYQLESEVVLSRRAGREHLSILRFAFISPSS